MRWRCKWRTHLPLSLTELEGRNPLPCRPPPLPPPPRRDQSQGPGHCQDQPRRGRCGYAKGRRQWVVRLIPQQRRYLHRDRPKRFPRSGAGRELIPVARAAVAMWERDWRWLGNGRRCRRFLRSLHDRILFRINRAENRIRVRFRSRVRLGLPSKIRLRTRF